MPYRAQKFSRKIKFGTRPREQKPLVGIIMGSKSDAGVMGAAREMLKKFGVSFEFKVVSAHRTPDYMFSYAAQAERRGIKVIIAGAGGAAHLPGMVASKTTLPVIGVPVKSKSLSGLDSLLSIVQMPKGIPVAAVAIDGAANAALLALRILATQLPSVSEQLKAYSEELHDEVLTAKV
jgi:5-(carboxyamino)imidazole ribonucleotide mutase